MKLMKNFSKTALIIVMILILIVPISIQALASLPEVNGRSVIAIDTHNGQILYQDNPNQLVEVGSITKLLSVYVAYRAFEENDEWDESTYIPISDNAYNLSQDYNISNVPLRQDYNYTLNELVESVAVGLANGSTLAMAEFVAGSEDAFVEMMEAQLIEWGIEEFVLYNSTGLPLDEETGATNQLSSEAVAVIAYHLVNDYPIFLDYSQQAKAIFKPKTEEPIEMLNYNYLIPGRPEGMEGVLGMMPGISMQDGESLVAYSIQDNFSVITVILGSDVEDLRYQDTRNLIAYTQRAYQTELVIEETQPVTHLGAIQVEDGVENVVSLNYAQTLSIVIPIIDTIPRLKYQFTPADGLFNERNNLVAPLYLGQEIGTMTISAEDIDVAFIPSALGNQVPVVIAEEIEALSGINLTLNRLGRDIGNMMESLRKMFVDFFN